ncbi:MAG: MFS transporter [Pseudomonadota bacterium]
MALAFMQHRIAVSSMFVMNGALVGSWAPAIPYFKDKQGLSESELGLSLLLIGIGSLVTMPITGAIIARRGSTTILRVAALACTAVLPLVLLAPSTVTAFAALLVFGGAVGSMDVSMNANAARIEQVYDRQIMSSCHGFWSLGALIGSGVGGTVLGFVGSLGLSVMIAAGLLVGSLVWGSRLMHDEVERGEGIEKPSLTLPRSLTIYLIALIALAGFTAEGAVLDWAALYLRDERDVPAWMAGYAFAAFAATMASVRFVGDPIRMQLGDQRTMTASSILAFAGFLMAGLAPNLALTIIGFGVAGLGLANIVPIAFAAADRTPGLPRGIGISIATFCGYAGILFAPPVIGFFAERFSFSVIFAAISVLALLTLAASPTVRRNAHQGSSTTTSTRVG